MFARLLLPLAVLAAVAAGARARHDVPTPAEPRFSGSSRVGVPVGLLPQAVTSFGAATLDGNAYVLGGYTGRPHDYRTRYQSRAFWRINLHDPTSVELLPNEHRIQSVALVADGQTLIRAGGMTIVDDVTRSTAECARFSPADDEWSALPALPRPRSSHEAAVVGRTLYLAGGWSIDGDARPARWHEDVLALDLDDPDGGWRSLPQPFSRRALAVAAAAGRLVVVGGMTSEGEISSRVDVLDPADGTWSIGPEFPGTGFGVAAVGVGDVVVASGMDGAVHSWRPGDAEWKEIGALVFPRFFHQLVPAPGGAVAAIGGIGRDVRTRHVERLELGPPTPRGAEVVRFTVPTRDERPGRFGAFLRGHELFLFGRAGARIDLRTLAVAEAAAPARGRAPLRTFVSAGGRRVLGVRDGGTTLQRFDPEEGAWEDAATLAAPFGACGWALDGRELWAFGGTDAETGEATDEVRRASTVRLEDGFAPVDVRMPRPRRAFAAATLDGAATFVGGRTAGGAWCEEVDVLDLATLEWRTAPAPPRPREGATLVPLDGRLLLVGGLEEDEAGDLIPARSVEVFDPERGRWSTFLERLDVAAEVVHAFPYRGHLLVAAGARRDHAVDVLLVRPPVERPALDASAAPAAPADAWPSFRGGAFGRTAARRLPTEWSEEDVAWTAAVPGTGQSSPVVRDGRVYVTSVEGRNKEHAVVSCFDAADGTLRWSRTLDASVRVELTDMVSQAAPTPAVDGERVYAFFESGDLVALDLDGAVLWHRPLAVEYGEYVGNHGLGASVALVTDGVVVLVDHDGPSYVLCVDRATGENRWRVERSPRISWATPVVARSSRGEEVVVSSAGSVEGYDAATGRRLWGVDDVEGNTVPSPTVLGELVVVGASSGDGNLALARPGGDDPAPRVVWRAPRTVGCGFASPLVLDDHVLLVNDAGILSCLSRETGALRWKHRLPSPCWASPIAAGPRVYLFGTEGDSVVLEVSDDGPTVLAENHLDAEGRVVGVAAVDGALIVREPSRLRALRAE